MTQTAALQQGMRRRAERARERGDMHAYFVLKILADEAPTIREQP